MLRITNFNKRKLDKLSIIYDTIFSINVEYSTVGFNGKESIDLHYYKPTILFNEITSNLRSFDTIEELNKFINYLIDKDDNRTIQ